jgi:carbonic anhydrase/acetyltransferase-like protein (isoleucine patch superfamily)
MNGGKRIDPSCFVHPLSFIAGDVTIGAHCSVWPFASIRGDHAPVEIGEGTNVQDSCTIHVSDDRPVRIGSFCTLGHGAIVHGATVGDCCIIGMNATILDGAEIGENSIVGANALVAEGKVFPPYSLILGVPGSVARTLPPESRERIMKNAQSYIHSAQAYREGR